MAKRSSLRTLREDGFSLLELMAVLAVVAVALSLVVPRMFEVASDEKAEELKRLASALTYAADLAVKQGMPLRWQAGKERNRFEKMGSDGVWHPVTDKALNEAQFQQLRVEGIETTGLLLTTLPLASGEGVKPLSDVVGEILLLPDGTVTPAEIRFTSGKGTAEPMKIETGSGKIVYANSVHANQTHTKQTN